MRKPVFIRAIVLPLAAVVSVALAMIGCGSHSSNPTTLTQSQSQAIALAVSNGIGQALTGAFNGAAETTAANPMRRNDAASNLTLPICIPNSTGEVCTWPILISFSCQGGGTMAVSGDIIASLTNTGSGSAQAQIAANPSKCSVDGMVINGAPQVNVATQVDFLNNNPVWPVTGTETGAVSYGPNPSGTCQLNLNYTLNSNRSCTVTGTSCGHSVSGSC